MTVIRRYPDTITVICDRNAGITWAGPNIPLDLDPREGKAEEEYVRADLHQGAVEALVTARAALHSACMFIGSTEGYGEAFARINAAITAAGGQ